MVLQVYHTTPTTPAGLGFNVDITGSVRIHTKRGLTESADLGEVAGVEITVDDPNLSLSFVPRQAIALIETTAPSGDQRVFTGYIASTSIVRCDDRLCMLQGRIWILECAEFNALMGWRIVRGENSDRPQETAENRLLWLMSTTFLNGLEDLGLIDWTDPAFDKVLPPVDYEGQWGKDVLADISAQTGLGFYGYVDETLGNDAGLAMFDFNTFTDLASTLRLSNVSGDVDDATTFAIGMDSRWTADGERIAPGVYATGADGLTSYGYSPTTQYAYGNVVRDQAAPMPNVTTQTALDAARNRLLNQHTDPDETFKTRIVVPAAKVNAIRKGYSLPVRLSHVPDRADFTDWRVVERAVSTPENEGQTVYEVDLDLVPMLVASGCNDQDFRVAGAPQYVQYGGGILNGYGYGGLDPSVFTLPFTPTPGNVVLAFLLHFSEAGTPGEIVGGTEIGAEQGTAHYGAAGGTIRIFECCPNEANQVSIIGAGDNVSQAFFVEVTPYVIQSVQTRSTHVPPDPHDQSPGVDVTPTAGSDVLILSFQMHGQKQTGSVNAGTTVVHFDYWQGADNGNPGVFIGYQRVIGASGTYLVGMNSLVGTEAGTSQAVIQVVLA